MTKSLNQNIFFSNIWNQNIFLEKNQSECYQTLVINDGASMVKV